MESMTGKTVLITGGTGGIGKETALGIAKLGARVIVTGRSKERAVTATSNIRVQSDNQDVHYLIGDMSAFTDIRQLAADFTEQYGNLDVLINNAGYLTDTRDLTGDGYEKMFHINVLAPLLLTHLLLPVLEQSDDARVINVTGGMTTGEIELDNLQGERDFKPGLTHYSKTKMAMEAMTYELAQRIADTGVKAYVAYPGAADTEMTRQITSNYLPFVMKLAYPIFRMFISSQKPANAAVSSIYLASSPDVQNVTGAYFNIKAQQKEFPTPIIKGDIPQQVYDMSVAMIGLENPIIEAVA